MSRPSVDDAARHPSATGAAPPPTTGPEAQSLDPLREAETLRALLHDTQMRLSRLLVALKQQQRHSRALRAAMDSLRQLRLEH